MLQANSGVLADCLGFNKRSSVLGSRSMDMGFVQTTVFRRSGGKMLAQLMQYG